MPLANTTRPPVHSYACSYVHSALLVGFDNAKITGAAACGSAPCAVAARSAACDMAAITGWVKAPPREAAPMSVVGCTARTIDSKSDEFVNPAEQIKVQAQARRREVAQEVRPMHRTSCIKAAIRG